MLRNIPWLLVIYVRKLILLSLLFKNHPDLTSFWSLYYLPLKPSFQCYFSFMPPDDISLPLTVFPVLNFIQDVEILLNLQDPNEVLSYLCTSYMSCLILTYITVIR